MNWIIEEVKKADWTKDRIILGTPPTLDIHESDTKPEWNVYFNIDIQSGTGMEFGNYSLYTTAFELIEETIKDSVQMFESSMIEGFQSMNEVEHFLKIACKCFGTE